MAKDSALARLPAAAKWGISIGLLVLAAIAYYVVFYSEISTKIAAAEQRESSLRSELSEAKAAEAAYQKDLEELARRRERERELNKILPPQTEYPAFLSAVQQVANMSGVNLTAWAPQAEIKEDFYARVPMKVELSGRFHQVAKFFYGIGQNDRIMNMENISIEQPEVLGDDIVVKVSGLATAFRALDKEETAKAEDRRAKAAQKAGPR
jgi:type IV pilus assembly protein PilO